jgi:hypothetical protein
MAEKKENMKNVNESEFLSFLYAEKERLHTNFSKPGWSNWAIGGAFIALLVYIFNILTTSINLNLCINWEVVLMLFISFLSITVIGIMVYPLLFPKVEIYYRNRITTFWDEYPVFELIISGLSFLMIAILLIISNNHSWMSYLFWYLSVERLCTVFMLFLKRNKFIYAGTKYKLLPSNKIDLFVKIISIGLFIFIAISSTKDYLLELNLYQHEVQIAAVFIGFWILIYIFLKTNSTPNKMLNGIDNIIDKYAYGNISQQDAKDELMCLRYGGNVNQIVKNDLSIFTTALSELEDINAYLDTMIKVIDEGKLTREFYYDWSFYCNNKRKIFTAATSKGGKLIAKVKEIYNIPNKANLSETIDSLLDFIQIGINKLGTTKDKFNVIYKKLAEFRQTYYCRKSGVVCADLECMKRNNKMSIKYALKKFPLKYALYIIIFRKR